MKSQNNFMNWENPGLVFITGSSSGIGAEFARQLAAQQFDLILAARRKDKLEELADSLRENNHINVEVLIADLSKMSDNEKLVSRIRELDNLDVLINNAGFGFMKPFLQIEQNEHIDMINVHFTSPVLFCHAALPGMMERKRGVIINTSSISAINKSSSTVMYTATKTAILNFSEILRKRIKTRGIYIQALCPGLTYTEFHDTESMSGFNRTMYPKKNWMNVEDVVSLSLNAVKTKKVIFIPGEFNRTYSSNLRKKTLEKYLNCDRL